MHMVGIVPLQYAFEHLVLLPNCVVAKFCKDTSLSQSMWVYTLCVGARFRKDTLCDVASVQWENLARVVARFRNDTLHCYDTVALHVIAKFRNDMLVVMSYVRMIRMHRSKRYTTQNNVKGERGSGRQGENILRDRCTMVFSG